MNDSSSGILTSELLVTTLFLKSGFFSKKLIYLKIIIVRYYTLTLQKQTKET